jgi:hypothetical protein
MPMCVLIQVKEELKFYVPDLAPMALEGQITFLTVDDNTGIGERCVCT